MNANMKIRICGLYTEMLCVEGDNKMHDFVNWSYANNLIEIAEDGTVTWKEAAIKDGSCTKTDHKFGGGRDQRKDLSDDYKDYCHKMGTVWPFKVVAKKGGKAIAPVGK